MIKMNRLLILLIGCLCCFSCVSKTDGFKVKMHLENASECEISKGPESYSVVYRYLEVEGWPSGLYG